MMVAFTPASPTLTRAMLVRFPLDLKVELTPWRIYTATHVAMEYSLLL